MIFESDAFDDDAVDGDEYNGANPIVFGCPSRGTDERDGYSPFDPDLDLADLELEFIQPTDADLRKAA